MHLSSIGLKNFFVKFREPSILTTCVSFGVFMQTVTSQVFNQNPTAVKRKASKEPVRITERGKVSHVLLSIEEYEAITGQSKNIVELLSMPIEGDDMNFDKFDASSIKPMIFD